MSDRQTQLQQKADGWIERNPDGYALLVHRSLDKAGKGEKFSIRQLCESLRWEKQHGLLKGTDEFAIPNELTRYIGLRIMAEHPSTEPHMTTRKPKQSTEVYPQSYQQPVNIPMGTAVAVVAWVKSVLSATNQALVWRVDLEKCFGIPPSDCEPDVYPDGEFTNLIDRMKSRLKTKEGETELVMMVRCRAGFRYRGDSEYTRVEYQGNRTVVVSEWTQCAPPVGEWLIVSCNSAYIADNSPLPDSYFRDGIPF